MKTDDHLHFEEQLKNTLHSDDKEKLRRKLADLQSEYLRTAQRLQRAERLDAVRRHVRSRISQHNQPDPELKSEPSSLILKSNVGHAPECPEPPEYPACPQTPDPNPVRQSSPRPRSALRLRSRRSRLRLERRSAEVARSKDYFMKTRDLSDTGEVEDDGTAGEEEGKVKQGEVDVMHESEELFSSAESESPSLLLTHWNIHGHADTENAVGITMCQEKEAQLRSGHQNESDFHSPFHTSTSPPNHPAEKRNNTTGNISSEVDGKEVDVNFRVEAELKHQETTERLKNVQSSDDILTTKEEINEITRQDKGSTLQEPCTIVEGLLFPAEYYVRTTRRMSSSQTQPDMQAVILSQLNPRQRRRRRVIGREQSKSIAEHSDRQSWTCVPSQKTASSSDDPQNASVQSSGENLDLVLNSHMDSQSLLSSSVTGDPAARGRKKRGRGRGRFQTPKSTDIPTSSSLCPLAVVTKPCVTQNETCLVPGEVKPAHSQCTDSQLSSAENKTLSTSGSGEIKNVFPIFKKRDIKTAQFPQKSRGSASWQSLILPSSSPSPTSTSPLFPVRGLSTLSIQDFHLPDEQFASLKLHKLQNVAVELGCEHFSSLSCNTPSSSQHSSPHGFDINGCRTILPLPLSPTPTASSLNIHEDHQAAAMPANLHKTSTERQHGDESISQSSTERDVIDNLQELVHSNTLCSLSEVGDSVLAHKEDEALALYLKSVSSMPSNKEALLKPDQVNESQDQMSEDAFSCDYPPQDKPKEPANTSACLQTTRSPQECPVSHLTVTSAEVSKQPFKADLELPAGVTTEEKKPNLDTQLLISPPVSIPYHFITPHHPSSTLASSPILPSLGITPHPDPVSFLLTSSPSPPPLSLPPSPSGLSQCPSLSQLEVAVQATGEQASPTTKEAAEEGFRTHISHTLKAAAGGPLVDACCFIGSSGTLSVAAAGKWAVCLWSQTSAPDWSLKHTWTFNKPVANVFPVPDTAGLMCVTLGQLEIREVRMLSSSNFMQKLICEGVLQVVIGLSESRVVTSSPSVTGSILQVFTLSDSSSSPSSHFLASPDVCVGALAPVDGLSDGLIGTDESGHLFVWNLKSGQLLCKVLFGKDLLHTACLRGYSHCGALFVLLQHHFLTSLDEKENKKMLNKETKETLFSLVAVNPLSRKSLLVTRLHPPTDWTDSLCEVDVNRTGVVGLSQSGCICVWGLQRLGPPQMMEVPVSDGWQLARWGEADTLVTGHLNGDITLHRWN